MLKGQDNAYLKEASDSRDQDRGRGDGGGVTLVPAAAGEHMVVLSGAEAQCTASTSHPCYTSTVHCYSGLGFL